MKARPALFSTPMVGELLADQKGQTRRVLKMPRRFKHWVPSFVGCNERTEIIEGGLHIEPAGPAVTEDNEYTYDVLPCPYGVYGDRLWVREAWVTERRFDKRPPRRVPKTARIHHLADGPAPEWAGRYRHARFMPLWVSRLLLEVIGVRVERLQEISEEDAVAEGIRAVVHEGWSAWDPETQGYPEFSVEPTPEYVAKHKLESVRHHKPTVIATARERFRQLWEAINGAGSWDENPWVWAVSFRRLQ